MTATIKLPQTQNKSRTRKPVQFIDSPAAARRRQHRAGSSRNVNKSSDVFYTGETSVNVQAFKAFLCRPGVSLMDAADQFEISEAAAEQLVYKRKPTDRDISIALEVYDKGFSLKEACVRGGVKMEILGQAIDRRNKRRHMFKVLRIPAPSIRRRN